MVSGRLEEVDVWGLLGGHFGGCFGSFQDNGKVLPTSLVTLHNIF